jgi:hypothetical protein
MQGLQGTLVVIIAAAAFLAGIIGERLRAELARQAWRKRRWRKGEGGVPFPFKTGAAPVTDPAEQLRLVMGASFKKRRLLSRSEAHVLYAAERAINTADLKWRVMAQVSLVHTRERHRGHGSRVSWIAQAERLRASTNCGMPV